MMHFQEGGLPENEAKSLIRTEGRIALDMDYVHGRGCKMVVIRENDNLFIRPAWYDHTQQDLNELLNEFNIEGAKEAQHAIACECNDCLAKRPMSNQVNNG